ncbi:MAG: DUF4391 domain-containing protein [Phycisphaeraceae bacterium]|nr:DUF4391 domain-containing protein [Phycisphaeraceae bacterium]
MTPDEVIEALALPREAMVGQRVPKTLLVENGAPTAADKRLIEGGVEELRWIAALKPTTVGIAAFRDSTREVVEVAVLSLSVREVTGTKIARLVELVHRAIPYHLMLITAAAASPSSPPTISLADKRWAQNRGGEGGKVVLDGDIVESDLASLTPQVRTELLAALALARQPRATLYTVYRGWIDGVLAAEAAKHTGAFTAAETPQRAAERQAALQACTSLEAAIASLRSAAAKEKQMARQVDLNLQLKRLQAQHDEARRKL